MASTVTKIDDKISKDLERGFYELNEGFKKGDILEIVTDAINFADTADGASATSVVTDATGVRIGDVVLGVAAMGTAAADDAHDAGVVFSGKVVDDNDIAITFVNQEGSNNDPGSQTFRILVMKMSGTAST